MSSAVRIRVGEAELQASSATLRGEDHHYLTRVRRVAVGDRVEMFDGIGHSRAAVVAAATTETITLEATGPVVISKPSLDLLSVLPLIKGDRMDFAVAKLTEIGATSIAVCPTDNAVVSLSPERSAKRLARFEKIATESARQCLRADVPAIALADSFADALVWAGERRKLIFDPGARAGLRERLADGVGASGIALLTGPEGGFSPAELEAAKSAGCEPTSLGPRVLRAETAAIAAAAAVLAMAGDLGESSAI